MSEYAVELTDLSKYYRSVEALHPLSLNISFGEVLGLFGHNGAGKSTLMKLILGVLKPSSGQLKVLGYCPRTNSDHDYRSQFGYLPENVSFYEHLSGREVLRYFARLKGHSLAHADALLEEVNLAHAADRPVKTYSKGMRQRLGLAQAFLGEPKILILDEPTVGLDPVATRDFYQMVDRLKTSGCAVILCSHVLPDVENHIDRAMILSAGRKLALGSLDELRLQAKLPTEFNVSGLSSSDLSTALNGYQSISTVLETTSNASRFTVPTPEKMIVMKHLLANQNVTDLQVTPPSLEALYRYYISDFHSQSAESQGVGHE